MRINIKTEIYTKDLLTLSKDFVWIDDKRTHIIGYYNREKFIGGIYS